MDRLPKLTYRRVQVTNTYITKTKGPADRCADPASTRRCPPQSVILARIIFGRAAELASFGEGVKEVVEFVRASPCERAGTWALRMLTMPRPVGGDAVPDG